MSQSKSKKREIETLFKDFYHPNPYINKKAYLDMATLWPEESISKLIDNLNHKDIVIRRKTVDALGFFGYRPVSSLVDLYLKSEDRVVRTSCLKVFVLIAARNRGELFPEEIFEVINKAINDKAPEIILTVVSLLRQLGEQGLPILVRICKGENLLMTAAAITALGEIDHPLAKNCLNEILNDKTKDSLIIDSANDALNTFT